MKIAELAVKTRALGFDIKEIPVAYRHDEDSRLVPKRPFGVVVGAFAALLPLWIDSATQFRSGILKRQPVRGAALATMLALARGKEEKPS
ncbi:MAG: hypothetical protein L0Y74_09075 [candidate division Zixibacteria bacterium]|nr:hypothetical protein [candidate division Zixibacteria bacterium]